MADQGKDIVALQNYVCALFSLLHDQINATYEIGDINWKTGKRGVNGYLMIFGFMLNAKKWKRRLKFLSKWKCGMN